MNPDFRMYQGGAYIAHSAKGSTWKNHKYLKKIGDRYVYAKEQIEGAVKDVGKKIDNTTLWTNERTATVSGSKGSTTTKSDTKVKDVRKAAGKAISKTKKNAAKSTEKAAKKGFAAISKALSNAKKSWNSRDERRLEKITQKRRKELIEYRRKTNRR